jgi:peptidoglycan hydrolase CwlO-like protein
MSDSDMLTMLSNLDETNEWMAMNEKAGKAEYEAEYKRLNSICDGILTKAFAARAEAHAKKRAEAAAKKAAGLGKQKSGQSASSGAGSATGNTAKKPKLS